METMPMPVYEFGEFRLSPEERVLQRGGQAVALTPKAFDALLALVEWREGVAEKAALMRRLWPDAVVEEANLTQQVFTLRKALGDTPEGNLYIRTVPRRGYRFVGDVKLVDPSCPPNMGGEASSPPATPARPARRMRPAAMAVAVVLLMSLTLAAAGRGPTAATTLAVLPFVNSSSAGDGEYVADGLTEGLIDELAPIPGLRVLARTTAFHYKGRGVEPRQAGRALHADAVLTGHVAPRDGRWDVHASLVDVADGRILWTERLSGGLGDLPRLQKTVRDAVAGRLTHTVRAGIDRTKRLPDEETYGLCLRGRYFWNKRTEDGLRRSIELYREALRRDPSWAEAWCGLADAYNVLPEYSRTTEAEAYPTAKHAATRALELDPELAAAHASLGFVRFWWDRDGPGADQEFRRALELNPGYATAHHWYGNVLLALGRDREALEHLAEAQRVDPLSLIIGAETGAALYHARRYDEAVVQLQRTIELDPRFPDAHFWLGRALLQRGDAAGAIREYRVVRELSGRPSAMLADLGLALRRAGRGPEAAEHLRQLEALQGEHPVAYGLAVLYTGLGRPPQALAALERAAVERATDLAFLSSDPVFDPLRAEGRFQELVARLRQPRQSSF